MQVPINSYHSEAILLSFLRVSILYKRNYCKLQWIVMYVLDWVEILFPLIFTTRYFQRRMFVILMPLHLEIIHPYLDSLQINRRLNSQLIRHIKKNIRIKDGI